MLDLNALPPVAEAAGLVGIVFLVAILLYVVYGAAEQLLGTAVLERMKKF